MLDKLLYEVGFFVVLAHGSERIEPIRVILSQRLRKKDDELLQLPDVVFLSVIFNVKSCNMVVHLLQVLCELCFLLR